MDYVFYMRYCMARSRLHEGVDMNLRFLRFLNRIIRQRFNALQVVQVPRAELLFIIK